VPHALVIEPDDTTRAKLLRLLTEAGYPTVAERDGEAGLLAAAQGHPDLVVLSPLLPGLPPQQLVPRLREAVAGVATVVVTCHADESELIAMLDAGVDDCCVQPEGSDMLLARVRAVLRRVADQAPPRSVLRLGGLRIDLAARQAVLDGNQLQLSPREFDLLAYLGQRVGQVVSKRELLAEVWRLPYSIADKTIDVHVSWLRRKLNECAQRPRYVHTVRGAGLRLDIPRD
jgi:DNA-binding response OmpR family regulator